VKIQSAENRKWNCDTERLRVLEEKLRDAQIQIEELQRKNKALEDGKDVGKRETMTAHPGGEKCLVLV
jgi:hypothetical protein